MVSAAYMEKVFKVDEKSVKLSVWDTAGQEAYSSLVPLYFRNASAVIIVYDVTRGSTFEDLRKWIKIVTTQVPDDVVIVVCGNKCDLKELRQVTAKQAEEYCEEIGAIHFETSAKTSQNVQDVFEQIVKHIWGKKHQNDDKMVVTEDSPIIIGTSTQNPSKCTC